MSLAAFMSSRSSACDKYVNQIHIWTGKTGMINLPSKSRLDFDKIHHKDAIFCYSEFTRLDHIVPLFVSIDALLNQLFGY